MNELYRNKINHLFNSGIELVATPRVSYLLNIINFDLIQTIFDIGSWHLKQSIELANIFNDESEIFAFEPNPISIRLCRENWLRLPFQIRSKISINELALNNKNGYITFFPVDEKCEHPNLGASSMFKFIDGLDGSFVNQKWHQKEINVESKTIDSWCLENKKSGADLIWMDVQGAELYVLQGAKETIKNTKVILTEVGIKPYYQGHTLKPEIDSFLNENDFIELKESFKMSHEFEADTIYVNTRFLK